MAQILLILFTVLFTTACNPFKVTDPNDPNFDPNKFSFSDYKSYEMYNTFRVLFPVGTEKSYVDRVLVKAGKAYSRRTDTFPYVVSYSAPPCGLINDGGQNTYMAVYDKNDRFLNIQGQPYSEPLYPDQLSYQDIKEAHIRKKKIYE